MRYTKVSVLRMLGAFFVSSNNSANLDWAVSCSYNVNFMTGHHKNENKTMFLAVTQDCPRTIALLPRNPLSKQVYFSFP